MHTHYDNLQVARNASDEVIKGAYKYLSQKHHPDKQPPEVKAQSERRMKLINEAYVVLSDPARRREHDAWIAEQEKQREGEAPPTPEPEQTKSAGLSAEARESYARSIARGHWPLALFWSFLGVSLIVGLLMRWIDQLERWTDRHPAVFFALVTAWILGGAGSIVSDRRKALLAKNDDDTLKHLYDNAARRRMLAVISSAILVAGILIAFAVYQSSAGGISEAHRETRSDSAPAAQIESSDAVPRASAGPKPTLDDWLGQGSVQKGDAGAGQPQVAPIKPTAPPVWNVEPAPRPAAAPAESLAGIGSDSKGKAVHVTNACDRVAMLRIAYKTETNPEGTWSIAQFRLAATEASDLYAAPGELFKVKSGSSYWFAKSEDGGLVWAASDAEPGKQFVVNGEATGRYTMLASTPASQYQLELTC